MKFVIEIDLTQEFGNTTNFKDFIPGYIQEVMNKIPSNCDFAEVLQENPTIEFANDIKVLILAQAQMALVDPETGKPGEIATAAQVLVTNQKMQPIEVPEHVRASRFAHEQKELHEMIRRR